MKQTAYKSLFRQFINRLIPPMVLTVALAMTANIVVGHNMARMEQSRRLQFLGASYAEALIKPLWDCDDTAAQAIMNSMLQSRAISGGRLHNACTGSTLASGVLSHGGMSPYVKQLVYDDGAGHSFNVGTLEIEFTPVSIMQRATDSLWEYLFVTIAMTLCLAVVTLLTFRRLISQPLRAFQQLIDKRSTSRDSPALAAELSIARRNDELSGLIKAYDELMETVARQQAELEQQARIDPLTGLGNRLKLAECLNAALARARRYGGQGYIVLIDLDDFKPINDTLGHAAGDFVLCATARRLLRMVRADDTVIRLGGDEFVLLIEARMPPIEVSKVIERILRLLEEPLVYEGNNVAVKASIGVSVFSGDENGDELLTQADQLMYANKCSRKAGHD